MFKIIVFLAFTVATCYGEPGTYCGQVPDKMYKCLHSPKLVVPKVYNKCDVSLPECERMTCVFRENNFLDGAVVNKTAVSAYFDQYAKDHPEWTTAVQHLKLDCLEYELKPQGAFLDCPAYDVMQCVIANFIKHALPSQWQTTPDCAYPQAFASVCPVCPNNCFAPQVPIGSCNACLALPRSP